MPLNNEFNKLPVLKAPTPQDLVVAIDKSNVEAVRDLISRGVDVAAADKLWGNGSTSMAGRGFTALGWAAFSGKTEIVRMLLEAGADVDGKDRWGYTPLMRAAVGAYEGIVKLLFNYGANLNEKNEEGKTAYDLAFNWGARGTAAFLREKNACTGKQDLLRTKARKLNIKPV